MENIKILITGSQGQLGLAFQEELDKRGIPYVACDRERCDITRYEAIESVIESEKPGVVINCAAFNDVDAAEKDEAAAFAVNGDGVGNLAEICGKHKIFFVHYSTDYVFDGQKGDFYTEQDKTDPVNVYGKSKLQGEELIRKSYADHLIFRVSWVFSALNKQSNFLYRILQWSQQGRIIRMNADQASVPTFVGDIVNVTLSALERGLRGLYHLTSNGYATRYELAKFFVKKMEVENLVMPVGHVFFKDRAPRPDFSCLSNGRLLRELDMTVSDWEDGVLHYVLCAETDEPVATS